MERSRLSRQTNQKTKKNTFFMFVGIILIIVFMFQFGLPLLVDAVLFISGANKITQTTNNKPDFIAPPVLDALPNATNSARIKISGNASEDQLITLFINGAVAEKTDVDSDNTFVFVNVELENGENLIQTKAKQKDQESDFSDSYTVIYKKDEPTLIIDAPSDNQTISKDDSTTEVRGKTDPGNKVTVNDFWAIVDETGNYSYRLQLQGGENTIKVTATDEAGNKKEQEIKVTHSQ